MKYIFEVKIKEGCTIEQYVAAWEAGSKIIQTYPGAKGTRLLKKVGEPSTLLAIAEWESKEARDAAMDALKASNDDIQRIWQAHTDFGELNRLGSFDETSWEVLPE